MAEHLGRYFPWKRGNRVITSLLLGLYFLLLWRSPWWIFYVYPLPFVAQFKHLFQLVMNLFQYFQKLVWQVHYVNYPSQYRDQFPPSLLVQWHEELKNGLGIASAPNLVELWFCFLIGHVSLVTVLKALRITSNIALATLISLSSQAYAFWL